MGPGFLEPKSRGGIDRPGGRQNLVGPEHDLAVTRGAGEGDAFLGQATPEAQTARAGILAASTTPLRSMIFPRLAGSVSVRS